MPVPATIASSRAAAPTSFFRAWGRTTSSPATETTSWRSERTPTAFSPPRAARACSRHPAVLESIPIPFHSAAAARDIVLVGFEPTGSEFTGVNLSLPDGSAISEFEILQDAMTGSGDDFIMSARRFWTTPSSPERAATSSIRASAPISSTAAFDTDGYIAPFDATFQLFLTNEAQFFSKHGRRTAYSTTRLSPRDRASWALRTAIRRS